MPLLMPNLMPWVTATFSLSFHAGKLKWSRRPHRKLTNISVGATCTTEHCSLVNTTRLILIISPNYYKLYSIKIFNIILEKNCKHKSWHCLAIWIKYETVVKDNKKIFFTFDTEIQHTRINFCYIKILPYTHYVFEYLFA